MVATLMGEKIKTDFRRELVRYRKRIEGKK